MKEGEEEKTKTYSALIWIDKAIQKEDIAFLDDLKVSVALFADLCSTCPVALREGSYTCTHGCVPLFVVVFSSVSFAVGTVVPVSPFLLLHQCHPSSIAKTTNHCITLTIQIIKGSEWKKRKSGAYTPFFTLDSVLLK